MRLPGKRHPFATLACPLSATWQAIVIVVGLRVDAARRTQWRFATRHSVALCAGNGPRASPICCCALTRVLTLSSMPKSHSARTVPEHVRRQRGQTMVGVRLGPRETAYLDSILQPEERRAGALRRLLSEHWSRNPGKAGGLEDRQRNAK